MFLLVLVATFGGGARYPFNDVTLSTDARVGDLLGRMSLKDKVGQLFMNAKMAVSPTGATTTTGVYYTAARDLICRLATTA